MPPARSRARSSKTAKPYASSREPSETDWKPDLDELDEDVKPGPSGPEAPDTKPARAAKGKAKGKSKAAATATGSKWTAEEDWALFQAIFPRAAKIDWGAVSAGVGRDAKVSLVSVAVPWLSAVSGWNEWSGDRELASFSPFGPCTSVCAQSAAGAGFRVSCRPLRGSVAWPLRYA